MPSFFSSATSPTAPSSNSFFASQPLIGAEPATNPSPGGFLSNIWHGATGMVRGISDILKTGASDVIAVAERAIRGEQANEAYVQEHGFSTVNLAQAMPKAVWQNTVQRYGPLIQALNPTDKVGFMEGITKFGRELYNDPLSYVMDALIVADGIGLAAKVGRTSGMLGKLPTFISDETATKILGPALTVSADDLGRTTYNLARYGTKPYGSTEAGIEGLKLSKNPLTRVAQRGVYNRLLSLSPEQATRWATKVSEASDAAGLPSRISPVRVSETATAAESVGMRVLRPQVSAFLAGHQTSSLLSWMRVGQRDLSAEAAASLSEIIPTQRNVTEANRAFKAQGIPVKLGKADVVDGEVVGQYYQGLAAPAILPDTKPVQVGVTNIPEIDMSSIPEISPFSPEHAVALTRKFGGDITASPSMTGAAKGGVGGLDRYTLAVSSLDDAESAAARAFREIGATPTSYFPGEGEIWDGFHFYGQGPNGKIIEISTATRPLLEAQAAASKIIERMVPLSEKIEALKTELGNMTKGATEAEKITLIAKGKQLKAMTEEYLAMHQWTRMQFDFTRAQWWSEHGGPMLDKEYASALRARSWMHEHSIEPWIKAGGGGEQPFATMFNRAYGPQRVTQFYGMLADWGSQFRRILSQSVPDTQIAQDLTNFLTAQKIPAPLIEQILGKAPWRGYKGGRDATSAASRLMKRSMGELWDYMVTEGGRGAEYGFPGFDWQIMNSKRLAQDLPIPSYMPHFDRKPSDYIARGVKSLVPSRPGITKNWSGLLYGTGRVEMDAFSAMERAGRIWINHQEMAGLTDHIVEKFGRELTPREIGFAQKFGLPGEVLVSPEQVRSMFNLRGEMMSDTIAGMATHGNLDRATADAMDILGGKLTTEGLNTLGTGKVYAIPKAVAKKFSQEVKLQFGNNIRIFFDTPMNLWKASVLSLSPRWVINNFFGNTIFMGLENPGALRYAISQLSEKNRAASTLLLGEENIRLAESGFFHGAMSQTLYAKNREFGSALSEEAGLSARQASIAEKASLLKDNPLGRGLGRWSDWVRNFNSKVEEAARRGVLIEAYRKAAMTKTVGGFHSGLELMRKAAEEGIDPALMSQALKSIDRTLGNFMTYSPMEQGIIRRFIMPFYGFYRHMAKVIVLMPIEHPLKGRVLQLIDEMNQGMEKDLPSYYQGQGVIFLGQLGGKDTLLRLTNLNPLSSVAQEGPSPLVGLLNPLIKIGIERSTGVSTFTGQAFEAPEDVIQTHDGQYWQIQRDGNGNVVGQVRVDRPLPPLSTHVLGQFGGVQLIPGFNLYPKSTILQLVGMAGFPVSQPKTSLASSLAFDREMEAQAQRAAQGYDAKQAQAALPQATNSFFS